MVGAEYRGDQALQAISDIVLEVGVPSPVVPGSEVANDA
jgi:hypothetical protein